MTVLDQVIAIIAEQALLQPSDITADQSLQDLGLDSLGLVEAIFALEEAFDISIPFNANDASANEFDLSSVASVALAVEGLVAQKAA